MVNLVLRKATLEDLQAVMTFNYRLFKFEIEKGLDNYIEDWSLKEKGKQYFQEQIKNQFVVLAEIEGKAVGYLSGSIYQDETYSYYEGKTAELNDMFIEQEFRKYGIGSKLIASFENWCKQNDAKRILVAATIGNDNAISFYKKNGFGQLNIILRKEI